MRKSRSGKSLIFSANGPRRHGRRSGRAEIRSVRAAESEPDDDPQEKRREGDQKNHSMERVLDVLGASPAALDDIVRGCGLPASAVRATLLELELEGRISRMGGDLVQLLR